VPCAAAALPGTLHDAQRFARQIGFPLVAKLATPWQSKSAKKPRSTSVIRTQDDLVRTWQACDESGSGALMLQEYVKGWDYFFHGYCDAHSRCRPGFVGHKERSYPAQAGLTSLGRWVDNPELHHQATELLTRVGFRGIVDLDYRFDPRTGTYKLLDFNPRLGAQFRLFFDTAGVDVVIAAHLDLTGREIPHGAPHLGRSFLVENYDPIAALSYRRLGLDLKSWLDSLRRADELAWFAKDDLAPFGLMCLRMGWRAITRPLARRSTRRPITTPLSARRAPA
jgi:predicted ATP-grasp superfamily ATP-dependent carboligase